MTVPVTRRPRSLSDGHDSRPADPFARTGRGNRRIREDRRRRQRGDGPGGSSGVPRPVSAAYVGRVHGVGGRHADHRRGAPGDRPRRQRAQGAAVGARARAQQRLRRRRAESEGLGDREPAEDEPRARDRRGARVRRRRAGRPLVRPLRGIARRRAQAVAVVRGPWLGQRHRKLARQRRHVPPVRKRLRGPVRTGGRPRQRGAAAHRHGSDARQRVVARVQARVGPGARSAVHAVELRDRHEDGAVADAAARGLHAAVDQGVARRRPRAARPTRSAS